MKSRKKEANVQKDAKETDKMEVIQQAVLRNIRGGATTCCSRPGVGYSKILNMHYHA